MRDELKKRIEIDDKTKIVISIKEIVFLIAVLGSIFATWYNNAVTLAVIEEKLSTHLDQSITLNEQMRAKVAANDLKNNSQDQKIAAIEATLHIQP